MYIEKLTGTLEAILPTGVIVQVGGIGYGVETPLSVMCSLPSLSETLTLWTHTYVREDAIRIFGFLTYEDRMAFEIMLGLSGVGPKVALAILSTLTVPAIKQAIAGAQPEILESVPGVGKRLAEKILLELKPKLIKFQPAVDMGLAFSTGQADGRLEVSDFQNIAGFDDTKFDHQKVEMIFEDLKSALSNLGFKDKQTQPLILRLRRDYKGGQLQDVMREALKLMADGSDSKKPAKATKTSDKSMDRELF